MRNFMVVVVYIVLHFVLTIITKMLMDSSNRKWDI